MSLTDHVSLCTGGQMFFSLYHLKSCWRSSGFEENIPPSFTDIPTASAQVSDISWPLQSHNISFPTVLEQNIIHISVSSALFLSLGSLDRIWRNCSYTSDMENYTAKHQKNCISSQWCISLRLLPTQGTFFQC